MNKDKVLDFFKNHEEKDVKLKKWREWINKEEELIGFLVDYRIKKGISQQEIADLIGVKQPAIARMEKGVNSPQLNTIIKYIDSLGLSLNIVLKANNQPLISNVIIYNNFTVIDQFDNNKKNIYNIESGVNFKDEYKAIEFTC